MLLLSTERWTGCCQTEDTDGAEEREAEPLTETVYAQNLILYVFASQYRLERHKQYVRKYVHTNKTYQMRDACKQQPQSTFTCEHVRRDTKSSYQKISLKK